MRDVGVRIRAVKGTTRLRAAICSMAYSATCPTCSQVSPSAVEYVLLQDFWMLDYSGAGDVTARASYGTAVRCTWRTLVLPPFMLPHVALLRLLRLLRPVHIPLAMRVYSTGEVAWSLTQWRSGSGLRRGGLQLLRGRAGCHCGAGRMQLLGHC